MQLCSNFLLSQELCVTDFVYIGQTKLLIVPLCPDYQKELCLRKSYYKFFYFIKPISTTSTTVNQQVLHPFLFNNFFYILINTLLFKLKLQILRSIVYKQDLKIIDCLYTQQIDNHVQHYFTTHTHIKLILFVCPNKMLLINAFIPFNIQFHTSSKPTMNVYMFSSFTVIKIQKL